MVGTGNSDPDLRTLDERGVRKWKCNDTSRSVTLRERMLNLYPPSVFVRYAERKRETITEHL